MTDTLYESLRGLSRDRRVLVIRNDDGTAMTDNQCTNANYNAFLAAGLPQRGWHVLRHTFATDAARFGVNPFTWMRWLGHKALTETIGYVDFAQNHSRPIPPQILQASTLETDSDRKVLKMLGLRIHGNLTATETEVSARN